MSWTKLLFTTYSPQSTQSNTEFFKYPSDGLAHSIVIQSKAKNLEDTNANTHVDAPEILRRSAPLDDKNEGGAHAGIPLVKNEGGCSVSLEKEKLCATPCDSVVKETYPEVYEEIPYENIVETLEEQMGGQPEHGSRNNFIFSMACHLRYVTNDDANWIARILPTYGEARDKWMGTIRSACARNQTKTMPRIMKRTLAICKQRLEEESEIINQKSMYRHPCPSVCRHSSSCW